MDQGLRNKLRNVVTQCRKLLEESVSQELQGKFGIHANPKKDEVVIEDVARLSNLTDEEMAYRKDLIDHYEHIKAFGSKAKEALAQLIREIAFTHLNRLCAYKMMEAREVYVQGQKFREAVSRGLNSNGVKFYLAENPEDERLFNTGDQERAYRHFLNWLGGQLSEEIGVLFSPNDPANRLYPRQKPLDDVLALLNDEELAGIWSQDETIGWVYQYFTPKELRDQARKESQAPRNSYELAFRNQFFTPRYVVEFLTDNTLGRIWNEMRQGRTQLADQCRYLVRQPDEVFLARATSPDQEFPEDEVIEAARLLREGNEQSFPPFDSTDDSVQRMIEMANAVSAYDRFGDEVFKIWKADDGPRLAKRLSDLSTQEILDWLFMTCRADRHGGRGEVYTEPWFVALANEVRRRALEARKSDLNIDERLRLPVFIPHRPKKDPREIKILDPACGSGHFLLYCFDLLFVIYVEAYADPDLGPVLQRDYPTLDELKKAVPGLILKHNLHGIDIDLRCTQIATLALWLRCQRAYQEMGLKQDRPRITRSNLVCAEPMPGEGKMLREFVTQVEPKLLGQLVEVVFDKMTLAGEAGSLLKIEEEIRDAVAEARRQWRIGPVATQMRLFNEQKPVERQERFDLSGITDTQFFERAEAKVVEALRTYAEKAQNGQGLQRRLFADDAERGFSFVEVCHKRFEVVLMNPPFGLFPEALFPWAQAQYWGGHNDIYAAFVIRTLSWVTLYGMVGAISSNSFLRGKQLEELRCRYIHPYLSEVCDLGLSVMDDAWVESAAYVLQQSPLPSILFIDVRSEGNKAATIVHLVSDISAQDGHVFVHPRTSFESTPRNALLYDMDEEELLLVGAEESLDPVLCTARSGLRTFDNDRFVRLWWECPPTEVGQKKKWVFFSKGGEFELFYQPLTLVVHWGPDGHDLMEKNREVNGQVAQARQGSTLYFRPGLTFPSRSELGFCARVFPEGCIFSSNGPVIVPNEDTDLTFLAGLLNSTRIRQLLDTQSHRRSYSPGLIRRINWKDAPSAVQGVVSEAARNAIQIKAQFYSGDETCPEFAYPSRLDLTSPPKSLNELSASAKNDILRVRNIVIHAVKTIDAALSPMYGEAGTGTNVDRLNPTWEADASAIAGQLVNYCVGGAFGRWDFSPDSVAERSKLRSECSASLTPCSPGMLQRPDGLPATATPEGYPLLIDWDGILVDDPDNSDDIIRRVRDVLELIWKDRAEAIEKEACEILGVANIRDYFRKPGAGGFWDDHVKRYSKSRRKAPIYWLLQSSKKNYALWIYYHRLDKDILFKARLNYVEPKIRLEEGRLDSLRSQKQASGEEGKGSRKLDKEIEKQEDFLSELRDFAERLGRAARLEFGDKEKLDSSVTYDPALNDGVVLNIAPLHELVPWKEAKAYWDDLLKGKYEWSSMGQQLRKKGLLR